MPVILDLATHRRAAGLSQRALATLTGLRVATISDIERGATTGVDFETLDVLARHCGVEPGALLIRVSEPPAKRGRGRPPKQAL